jgi:crossover junction endodeoxyribonuclease RuvC
VTVLGLDPGLAGNPTVDKALIQKLVRLHLGMRETPRPEHAADALAVAITHAGRASAQRCLEVLS